MQPATSLVPATPNAVASPAVATPPQRWRGLDLVWPGVGLWRMGMQKQALGLATLTAVAATGAVLAPWGTWDGVVVSLVAFRAVLGLWVAGATRVKTGVQELLAYALAPEQAVLRARGLRGAVIPVALLVMLTVGLGTARWSTRRTVQATTTSMALEGKTHVINDVDPHRVALVMPPRWTVQAGAPAWPTVLELVRDDGACRARLFLVAAPPLPDAAEAFYVSRMMAHHLGHHVVEAQDAMFVSMWPTRQYAYARGAQQGVLTAVRRDLTWNVLQMDAAGGLEACTADFTTLRSSWMVP